jgi:transketolase
MREQFVRTVTELFEEDAKTVLVLGDIGVHGFAELASKYPDRVINIGICEQATIGVIAGMAKEGLHPIFYTIAPFASERCLEQIKIDIGYQNLPVTIVSVGGSYDYGKLGCTHHCPADVAILKTIPGINIFAPAYRDDVDNYLHWYHGIDAVYMRLPDKECLFSPNFWVNPDVVIIAFGDTIDNVYHACYDLGAGILQRTEVSLVPRMFQKKKVVIVEPWYEGTMHHDVQLSYPDAKILSIGVPRKFITTYCSKEEHDKECGLDIDSLRKRITNFING